MRRLVPLLVLLALLAAPYGRAQARATVHHAPAMAMAGHCDPAPPADPVPARHGSIDCMIACAAIAFAAAPELGPVEVTAALPEQPAALRLEGLRPEAEPPPPRTS